MFARNALRVASKPAFTTKSLRTLTTSSATSDNMNPHGVEISKAQRVAQDGFVSGKTPSQSKRCPNLSNNSPQQSATHPSFA